MFDPLFLYQLNLGLGWSRTTLILLKNVIFQKLSIFSLLLLDKQMTKKLMSNFIEQTSFLGGGVDFEPSPALSDIYILWNFDLLNSWKFWNFKDRIKDGLETNQSVFEDTLSSNGTYRNEKIRYILNLYVLLELEISSNFCWFLAHLFSSAAHNQYFYELKSISQG